ncbi:hypothetical protein HNQ34_001255 [Anoxybacillus tepidamans]|uniref:Uncharacterized protein n=1 Tax=Anoxybacteroides tepidamans TaxID=265948 RepID=A0A7W8MU65_9BACL|nr:hypothetical protein [Anoxybacillus tepidamans]
MLISSQAVLLCEYNGDAIFHTCEEKIRHNEPLTAEETMKLILVPLMHSRFDRQTMIEKTIEIAKNLLNVLPIQEVTKRTGLTIAEVADLAKEMDK